MYNWGSYPLGRERDSMRGTVYERGYLNGPLSSLSVLLLLWSVQLVYLIISVDEVLEGLELESGCGIKGGRFVGLC